MSHAAEAPTSTARPALAAGKTPAELAELLTQRLGATKDVRDRWDLTLVVAAARLREALLLLRDDPALRFDQLLDIAGIDYLAYPGHRDARFAVVYNLKSTVFRHRVRLKVLVEEDAAEVPSVHDLFRIADWQERETYDQYGIVFAGHPNLKRLLNHHEFQGHPLRKDYPCQKRQKLSVSDPLIDQLEARLAKRGYQVVDRGAIHDSERITAKPEAAR